MEIAKRPGPTVAEKGFTMPTRGKVNMFRKNQSPGAGLPSDRENHFVRTCEARQMATHFFVREWGTTESEPMPWRPKTQGNKQGLHPLRATRTKGTCDKSPLGDLREG